MKRSLSALGVLMMFCSVVAWLRPLQRATKTDPVLGTWKLNSEKSTPKPPPGVVSRATVHIASGWFHGNDLCRC